MRTVYLAGPIKGLTFSGATAWRRIAADLLEAEGIRSIDPVERELRNHQGILDCAADGLMSNQRAIVVKDRDHIRRADAMLVNLDGAERVSIGTMIEFGWADAKRIPVVTVMQSGNPHDHAFVRELSGWVVPTIEAGVSVLAALFSE